jgi:hypothetical protein
MTGFAGISKRALCANRPAVHALPAAQRGAGLRRLNSFATRWLAVLSFGHLHYVNK